MAWRTAWLWKRRFVVGYVILIGWFGFRVGQFYEPHTGFSSMMLFGERYAPSRLPRLHDVPIYTYPNSAGYDGQFYAQVAVAGNPFDPDLRKALDSPAYRVRRALMPAVLHVIGLGRPALILSVYALSNVICWLVLAWLLARWWFPPDSLDNLLRWAGTLFGAGLLTSVARALTDGPAVLLIAVGVRCLEQNRRWLGAGILGAAGLVRETSIIAAAALLPPARSSRGWLQATAAAALCVVPAVLWTTILFAHFGTLSKGALDLPLVGLFQELQHIAKAGSIGPVRDEVYVVVAMLIQVGFIGLYRRPSSPWWRVGLAFSVLFLFLGWGFWEDAVSGVPRAIVPLTLAFNVLVPRSGRGRILLLAGNLTVLSASSVLGEVPNEQTIFVEGITCEYRSGWYDPEHHGTRTWRWASGSAVVRLHNPRPTAFLTEVGFDLISDGERAVEIGAGAGVNYLKESIPLQAGRRTHARFGPLVLPPGDTAIAFDTDRPPSTEPGPNPRQLAFSIQKLALKVLGPAPRGE